LPMPERLRITSQIDGTACRPEHQAARQAQFDGRARDAADVALVIGVAWITSRASPRRGCRPAACRPRGSVPGTYTACSDGLRRAPPFPLLDGIEVQILEQRLAALDDLQDSRKIVHCTPMSLRASPPRGASALERPAHSSAVLPGGVRRPMKAPGPRWRRGWSSGDRGTDARPRPAAHAIRARAARAAP